MTKPLKRVAVVDADLRMDEILVIKLGALGDLFLALDSIQAIRAHHPGSKITLLTRKPFTGLAQAMPWFDEVWADPVPKLWQVPAWWAFARRLRRPGFARVYDLQGNDRAQFYRRLGGWARRQGGPWVAGSLTQRGVDRARLSAMPVVERHRQMLSAAGVPSAGPADLSWLDAPLTGIELPARFVVLVPGCAPTRLYKRWAPDAYAALARDLASRGMGVVVVGTGAEEKAIAEVCAGAPEAVNLCGRTTIAQLGALARRAVGVVGNDTGPVHITAAVGAPTLVLMCGRSDPVRMKPHGPDVACLQSECLADLTPQAVMAALRLRGEAVA